MNEVKEDRLNPSREHEKFEHPLSSGVGCLMWYLSDGTIRSTLSLFKECRESDGKSADINRAIRLIDDNILYNSSMKKVSSVINDEASRLFRTNTYSEEMRETLYGLSEAVYCEEGYIQHSEKILTTMPKLKDKLSGLEIIDDAEGRASWISPLKTFEIILSNVSSLNEYIVKDIRKARSVLKRVIPVYRMYSAEKKFTGTEKEISEIYELCYKTAGEKYASITMAIDIALGGCCDSLGLLNEVIMREYIRRNNSYMFAIELSEFLDKEEWDNESLSDLDYLEQLGLNEKPSDGEILKLTFMHKALIDKYLGFSEFPNIMMSRVISPRNERVWVAPIKTIGIILKSIFSADNIYMEHHPSPYNKELHVKEERDMQVAEINAKKVLDVEEEITKRAVQSDVARMKIIEKLLECDDLEKIEALSKFLSQ